MWPLFGSKGQGNRGYVNEGDAAWRRAKSRDVRWNSIPEIPAGATRCFVPELIDAVLTHQYRR